MGVVYMPPLKFRQPGLLGFQIASSTGSIAGLLPASTGSSAPLKHVVYQLQAIGHPFALAAPVRNTPSTPSGLIVTLTALDLFAKSAEGKRFCFASSSVFEDGHVFTKYVRNLFFFWLPKGRIVQVGCATGAPNAFDRP